MSKGDQRRGDKGDQDNQEEAAAQKESQHLFEDATLVEGVLRLIETVQRSNNRIGNTQPKQPPRIATG